MKKLLVILLSLVMTLSLCACGSKTETTAQADPCEGMTWDEIVEAARGTTVSFYGWGGDEQRNAWLEDFYVPYMKDKYDITLKVVGMDINDILSKLSSEKEAGEDENGSIDMIWINGENFYSCKENGMLYGPFTDKLPNMSEYVDTEAYENNYDFGKPIEGYEAPYSSAKMVMYADTAKTGDALPTNADEFMEFCKANKGKVTYPEVTDFTGSTFMRQLIYETCGSDVWEGVEADKDAVQEAMQPAIDYMVELNQYLWQQGKQFPADRGAMDTMFANGELVMGMTYEALQVGIEIEKGNIPKTVKSFEFADGMIANTNYMAIAYNSPNKAGALVAINAMMSPEMQLSSYEEYKHLTILDLNKLDDKTRDAFNAVDAGEGNLTLEQIGTNRLPETPADIVPIAEEVWRECVVGK